MKHVYHDIAQLPMWNERQLEARDAAQLHLVSTVKRALTGVNRAWTFERVEAPVLIPRDMLSAEYSDDDIWATGVSLAGQQMVLRPETTPGTYAAIRAMYPRIEALKPPRCFWQVAKSFRREKQSTASRLRFFEFTQLELQCLFTADTKADYRDAVMGPLESVLSYLCRKPHSRIVDSDRLPSYSESTLDIEALHLGHWREVASVSYRTDFPPFRVLEIAIGLDRVVAMADQPRI
jgi:glycyl-tRNA synthetase